jgi:hypothetical protein
MAVPPLGGTSPASGPNQSRIGKTGTDFLTIREGRTQTCGYGRNCLGVRLWLPFMYGCTAAVCCYVPLRPRVSSDATATRVTIQLQKNFASGCFRLELCFVLCTVQYSDGRWCVWPEYNDWPQARWGGASTRAKRKTSMYRYGGGGGGTSWRNMHATDSVKGTSGNRRTGSSSEHAPTPRGGQGRRKN